MKKLAMLMMMLVLAIFMMPALASADGHGPWGAIHSIKGIYAVTGVTICNPSSPSVFEAEYTFRGNGTGSVQGVSRSLSVNATPPPAANGGYMNFSATFEYDVMHDGRITFQYPAGGNSVVSPDGTKSITWDKGPSHGVISPDGKTITITCGPPVSLSVLKSSGTGVPAPGTPANCITSAVGVRVH